VAGHRRGFLLQCWCPDVCWCFNSDASLRELTPGTESLCLLPAGVEEGTFLVLSINVWHSLDSSHPDGIARSDVHKTVRSLNRERSFGNHRFPNECLTHLPKTTGTAHAVDSPCEGYT